MEHFSRTDCIYQEHRERPQSIPLGFEIMVTAELYQVLKQRLGDCVYLDFPVGKRGRIDLAIQRVRLPDGSQASFPIDAFLKNCLLNGIDELGYLLSFEEQIAAFEAAQR